MEKVFVNGREYEFADVSVGLAGVDIIGLRGIKYGGKQEKEVLHAKGNKGVAIQRGNKDYDGEITLTQSEVIQLQEYARATTGEADLLNLHFNIVVCYGNPSRGEAMITDRVHDVEFTENYKGLKQGDKFMEITVPFIALNVEYNC